MATGNEAEIVSGVRAKNWKWPIATEIHLFI